MRYLRSTILRARLYFEYDGKCAICKTDLLKSWHADHIIPWTITQCTEYENMQPLCPSCNLKKGNKTMTSQFYNNICNKLNLIPSIPPMDELQRKEFYNNLMLCSTFDMNPLRIGQKGAINCILYNLYNGDKTIGIILPTRYGKSDCVRLSAIEIVENDFAFGSIIATPAANLRKQIVDQEKTEKMISRYKINNQIRFDEIYPFSLPLFDMSNREHFVTMTTQMLSIRIDDICQYIKNITIKYNKPIVVFIDESHSGSENNSWGECVPKIIAAGGIVVLCTATPFRDDNKKIPGFLYNEINKEDKTVYTSEEHQTDNTKIIINKHNDQETQYLLEPHYEHSYAKAWDEKVICKISRALFNILVQIPAGKNSNETKDVRIRDMSLSECRKYLGVITRDQMVVEAGARELVFKLKELKLHRPQAQAIVFSGNDKEEDNDDGHARQIAKAIKNIDSTLKIQIATTNQNDPQEIINQFEYSGKDILIVKQMGGVGIDNQFLKVALDLSAVRTKSAWIQRITRTCTIWDKCKIAHLITPADILSINLWTEFIQEQGGSATTHDFTLIDTFEKEKIDNVLNKNFEVLSTERATISDSDVSEELHKNLVNQMIKEYPELQDSLTDAKIEQLTIFLANISSISNPTPVETLIKPQHTGNKRALIRASINKSAKKLAHLKYDYNLEKSEWEKYIKSILFNTKNKFNIKGKLSKCKNIEQLENCDNDLKEQLVTAST